LRVARIIRSAALQSLDVIEQVAGASAGGLGGGRARVHPLERSPLFGITLDASIAVAFAGGAVS